MHEQTVSPKPCQLCGKQTILVAVDPHPTHSKLELLTFRCEDCRPVRTVSRPKEGSARHDAALEARQ
jgi:hypothetical protein